MAEKDTGRSNNITSVYASRVRCEYDQVHMIDWLIIIVIIIDLHVPIQNTHCKSAEWAIGLFQSKLKLHPSVVLNYQVADIE
jgi:hypothetical protein